MPDDARSRLFKHRAIYPSTDRQGRVTAASSRWVTPMSRAGSVAPPPMSSPHLPPKRMCRIMRGAQTAAIQCPPTHVSAGGRTAEQRVECSQKQKQDFLFYPFTQTQLGICPTAVLSSKEDYCDSSPAKRHVTQQDRITPFYSVHALLFRHPLISSLPKSAPRASPNFEMNLKHEICILLAWRALCFGAKIPPLAVSSADEVYWCV